MQSLLPTIALLACPVGMAVMMWAMMRGQGGGDTTAGSAHQQQLDALQAEVDRLRADRDRTAGRS